MGTEVINHQAVSFMLADMAVGIETARLMVRRAAWEIDQGMPHTPSINFGVFVFFLFLTVSHCFCLSLCLTVFCLQVAATHTTPALPSATQVMLPTSARPMPFRSTVEMASTQPIPLRSSCVTQRSSRFTKVSSTLNFPQIHF